MEMSGFVGHKKKQDYHKEGQGITTTKENNKTEVAVDKIQDDTTSLVVYLQRLCIRW